MQSVLDLPALSKRGDDARPLARASDEHHADADLAAEAQAVIDALAARWTSWRRPGE